MTKQPSQTRSKAASEKARERAIFKLYSLGVVTARDDWVYSWTNGELDNRLPWLIERYEAERARLALMDKRERHEAIEEDQIKLTRALKNDLAGNVPYKYDPERNRRSLYRPFVGKRLHFWPRLNEMLYRLGETFPLGAVNESILLSGHPNKKPFQSLATDTPHSYHTLEDTESLPRYRYTKSGERIDNITDWALNKFVAHYGKKGITKDAIFHYVYAVLHDPVYRETYALNLKREFPRIPFYPDFTRWAAWGEALMAMHIGYEEVAPWPVARIEAPATRAEGTHPKPILRSNAEAGLVIVDADSQIGGIPREAWDYRLGNRSAIDWVLDQHKEKTPRDPTIREKFNTYRFADYKERMIALLAKVVRVSVDTVAITEAMRAVARETA